MLEAVLAAAVVLAPVSEARLAGPAAREERVSRVMIDNAKIDEAEFLRITGEAIAARADRLLTEVWAEVTRVMRAYFHSWRPSDMLIWDNTRVLHQACGCDPADERVMHRTTIKGDYGLGRWQAAPAAVGQTQP